MPDVPPAHELMTVTLPQGAPSLAAAAERLGVAPQDLDTTFGVVPIDPDKGVYAVQVRSDRLPKNLRQSGEGFQGPWSNPRIAPFGPVQDDTTPPDKKTR